MKKIIGNTVGMGLPKPNLMQTDPSKGDYVYGKEEFLKDPNLKGDKGDPFTYDDFTPEQLAALKGAKGEGGYTPVKGKDYFDGQNGKDGYTPVKGKDYFDGKDGKDGTNGKDGEDGYTPVKGKDYYTETDKADMVQSVLAALPTWEGGSY